jgi:hypothetical protein
LINAVPTEPHRPRIAKDAPVAALGGISFENPPLDAAVIACLAYFFPLPMAYEGQGKEMSFSKDRHRLIEQFKYSPPTSLEWAGEAKHYYDHRIDRVQGRFKDGAKWS